jgi:cell division protein FtsW (lipid II flippase)
MRESVNEMLKQQLTYQSPTLAVCLVACVLALVFVILGRGRVPAALALAGALVLAVAIIIQAVVQANAFEAYLAAMEQGERRDAGLRYSEQLRDIGIAGGCGRGLGLGLMVAAIFVGRGSRVARPEYGIDD